MKRVIRILSYEGNPKWVDTTLALSATNKHASQTKTFFAGHGTIKELHCVEIKDDESLNDVLRRIADETRK